MRKNQTMSTPFWRDKRIIPILLQTLFAIIVVLAFIFFITNALEGLRQIGITLGFTFLKNAASFGIGDTIIAYTPADSYVRALLVGLTNTLKVSIFGIILATIIGFIVGISRLSSNWLVRTIAGIYTEIFRNTPLLVQILIWFFAVFIQLPRIEEQVHIGPIYFSNRGMAIPWLEANSGSFIWGLVLLVGIIGGIFLWKSKTTKRIETGKNTYPLLWSIGSLIIASIIAILITRTGPFNITIPSVDGKMFVGGYRLRPEFSAILIGLVIYTSTYIAEVVRAGIQGVPKGQVEAAKALGLKGPTTMRFVVLPQAIRIIIPPLTSQYLNLIKNSSLAVAVGYPDLVSVGGTILNQTGRAIELILIMVIVYLTFSIITSIFMNIFNSKFQLVER
ncbi:ABC transporter permease subunit [Bacillus sp. HMF5848]|uniref:amino acid ABC transporter permease n=1 Tax=Bacillus sp. HMF5848 TaxID=2495421 RepID=UPI000F791822|nr:ABC transporter permease subunit [Bacillus sp. HMF5848]RSK26797.1 ABC transporter permease subunit [Bacillus sp. HMF5848]